MLLSQVWSAYEADKTIEGLSPHTIKAYRIQTNVMIRSLGDIHIEDVNVGTLKVYLAESHGRLKPSSQAHRIKYIRAFFRYAHEEGFTATNPSSRIKFPKEGARVPKFLKEETLELLRINCKSALEGALIEFMYSAGVRIGEVHGLNRDDFNWENRSVIVRGKGDKEREVYFSKRAEIWLKRYLDERVDEDEALIVTQRKPHRRTSIAQIRWIIKRIAKRAGVDENVYPHKMRHTYATHLVNRGAPLEIVQDFLGHSKLETTRIYAALSGEHRREQYRKYGF